MHIYYNLLAKLDERRRLRFVRDLYLPHEICDGDEDLFNFILCTAWNFQLNYDVDITIRTY
jgi:hypothetical protein